MKRIFTLIAAAGILATATAGTRVLYNQNFEGVTSAAEAGWTSPANAGALLIKSDDFGQYLSVDHKSTNANGRSYDVYWGTDFYEDGAVIEDGVYTVKFDLSPTETATNQYNTAISVLSNLRAPDNQPFIDRWSNQTVNPEYDAEAKAAAEAAGETYNVPQYLVNVGYLFDLAQVQLESQDATQIQFKVNGDANDLVILPADWYTVTLNINTVTREVEYSIESLSGETMTSGTRVVPEADVDGTPISMYAEGLHVMAARYTTILDFDNMQVSCESSADVANTPAVALTRVGKDANDNLDLKHRAYTITWMEGEIMNYIGTDGKTDTIFWDDCDGSYEYTTTTSGTLKVWTECGSAKSEEVIVEVDCEPIALPEPVATITSVSNGYGKTYKFTVDNTNTPLSPVIFIQYSFQGENGESIPVTEAGSGVVVNVNNKGTLTLTTAAFGYKSTTITIENNKEYGEKYVVDFARMTPDEIKAKGFAQIDDLNASATSGENNWTARKRLFYYDAATETVDDEGNTVYTAVYPFGYIADDDTEHVMHRYQVVDESNTEEVAATLFDHITLWNGLTVQWNEHLGILQNATKNNYNMVKIRDCGAHDVVVVNTTNNYGGDSCHPVCNNVEEYWAQLGGTDYAFAMETTTQIADESLKTATCYVVVEEDGSYTLVYKLYRIDTAMTKVTVFEEKGGDGINDIIATPAVIDNAYYTIDGLKLDSPTHSGLYIHNGKKVYIVK